MSDVYHAVSQLQAAAASWENAVEDVQDALSCLLDIDPEMALERLGLGRLNASIRLACEHEPDLAPPQDLRELADDLAEALAETLVEEEDEALE